MKISILVPTRKRPENVKRLYTSAMETADNPELLEFVFYIDTDDMETLALSKQLKWPNALARTGGRIVLSQMWNECQKVATGEIYMHAGDDIVFKTKGWDSMVRKAFEESKDRILFVHGDDLHWNERFGTHGFLHRNWVNAVSYFVPPYFSCDYNDTWLNDVANALGRRKFLPFVTEHMHPIFKKSEWDATHLERIQKGKDDNVGLIYSQKLPEREADIKKLQDFINNHS